MGIRSFKYKNKRIKVKFKPLQGLYGVFYPHKLLLELSPKLSKQMLTKTIFHELWHIICYLNKVDINKIGEEKTALLTEEYVIILKQNKNLRKLINEYLW